MRIISRRRGSRRVCGRKVEVDGRKISCGEKKGEESDAGTLYSKLRVAISPVGQQPLILSITSLHRQHQHQSSSVLSFSCLHLQVSMNNSEDRQNSSLTLYVLQSMAGIMIILTLHAVTMVELLPIFKKAYWSLAAAGFVYVCFVFSMTYPDVQRLYALRALWLSHQTTDDAL
jgi:hypothetical protein